jgi:hypothetical protein
LAWIVRGKDDDLLDLPEIQARLAQPPNQEVTHSESGTCRALFNGPDVLLTATGPHCRVIIATRQASSTSIGVLRDGVVSERFFPCLPQGAFPSADGVALSLHRGAFEPVLSDEDQEQQPDRWCSQRACGQECWHVGSQWMWNLRLELGHRLHPTTMRPSDCAPAHPHALSSPAPEPLPQVTYGLPQWANAAQMGGVAASVFTPQADGTLLCPAGLPLSAQERRPEREGSRRVVSAARIGQCRACLLRVDCLGYGSTTTKPRRVSAVLWPVLSPLPGSLCRQHVLPLLIPLCGGIGVDARHDERG